MKVKASLDASPPILREWVSGAGDDELKSRRWGFVLPRCLSARVEGV
jgi:hypothetical protein